MLGHSTSTAVNVFCCEPASVAYCCNESIYVTILEIVVILLMPVRDELPVMKRVYWYDRCYNYILHDARA